MPTISVADFPSIQQIKFTHHSYLIPRMKIIRAIILLSINSSSAIESTEHPKGLGVRSSINDCDAYCRFAYKYPQNQAACVRELVNLGTDCSRGMSFLQEDSASSETAMSEIEESKGPKDHTSIDDCDAYCRNSYKNPYTRKPV